MAFDRLKRLLEVELDSMNDRLDASPSPMEDTAEMIAVEKLMKAEFSKSREGKSEAQQFEGLREQWLKVWRPIFEKINAKGRSVGTIDEQISEMEGQLGLKEERKSGPPGGAPLQAALGLLAHPLPIPAEVKVGYESLKSSIDKAFTTRLGRVTPGSGSESGLMLASLYRMVKFEMGNIEAQPNAEVRYTALLTHCKTMGLDTLFKEWTREYKIEDPLSGAPKEVPAPKPFT